jgi:hypothetical protein
MVRGEIVEFITELGVDIGSRDTEQGRKTKQACHHHLLLCS